MKIRSALALVFFACILGVVAPHVVSEAIAGAPTPTPATWNNTLHLNGSVDFTRPVLGNGGAIFDAGVTVNSTLFVDGGVTIGLQGGPMTKVIPWSSTIDFATGTITSTESSGITVAGAVANCSCVIGPPATGGSTNAVFSCYVSAADTVKARHTPAGTADDPASATYSGFVICP